VEIRCDRRDAAREIAGPAIRLTFGRKERADDLRLLPFPDAFYIRSIAIEFFTQNSLRSAILRPHHQQVEKREKKCGQGQPGAGHPKEEEPARVFARREQWLKESGAAKEHKHCNEKCDEHHPTSRRLIANHSPCRMNGEGNNS